MKSAVRGIDADTKIRIGSYTVILSHSARGTYTYSISVNLLNYLPIIESGRLVQLAFDILLRI